MAILLPSQTALWQLLALLPKAVMKKQLPGSWQLAGKRTQFVPSSASSISSRHASDAFQVSRVSSSTSFSRYFHLLSHSHSVSSFNGFHHHHTFVPSQGRRALSGSLQAHGPSIYSSLILLSLSSNSSVSLRSFEVTPIATPPSCSSCELRLSLWRPKPPPISPCSTVTRVSLERSHTAIHSLFSHTSCSPQQYPVWGCHHLVSTRLLSSQPTSADHHHHLGWSPLSAKATRRD